jgi:hypothetical protein
MERKIALLREMKSMLENTLLSMRHPGGMRFEKL